MSGSPPASEPASASVSAKAMSRSPDASDGNQRDRCSSVPARSIGSEPSSWTARISPVVAQARLSCSMARQSVRRSPPRPPYASGNGRPRMSCAASSARTSCGNSDVRSISAARGAIRSSARTRTASRSISWSSVRRYGPEAAGCVTSAMLAAPAAVGTGWDLRSWHPAHRRRMRACGRAGRPGVPLESWTICQLLAHHRAAGVGLVATLLILRRQDRGQAERPTARTPTPSAPRA